MREAYRALCERKGKERTILRSPQDKIKYVRFQINHHKYRSPAFQLGHKISQTLKGSKDTCPKHKKEIQCWELCWKRKGKSHFSAPVGARPFPVALLYRGWRLPQLGAVLQRSPVEVSGTGEASPSSGACQRDSQGCTSTPLASWKDRIWRLPTAVLKLYFILSFF